MDFPVSLQIPQLRPRSTTMRSIARELLDNMTGSVESGILDNEELSQTSGPPPVFEGVQPFGVRVGNILLQSDPSDNRNQIFQAKAGVVALLDDAYGVRPTITLQEGLVSVDWDKSDNFLCILSGNRQSTFYMVHQKAGMNINLLLVNNGTNQTAGAWDAAIKWQGNIPPAVPAAPAGGSALVLVTVRDIGNVLYGEYLNYTAGAPVGIGPVVGGSTHD